MGDGDYMYAFQQIVMPVANEFDPDFVIVAAGFDAAAGDELGGCFVTPPCYAHMTHMLKSLAGGKIAVCLEGGYNFHAIAKSALAVTKVLMGEPPDRMGATGPSEEARRTIREVKEVQSKYWRCLWPKGTYFSPHPQLITINKPQNPSRASMAARCCTISSDNTKQCNSMTHTA